MLAALDAIQRPRLRVVGRQQIHPRGDSLRFFRDRRVFEKSIHRADNILESRSEVRILDNVPEDIPKEEAARFPWVGVRKPVLLFRIVHGLGNSGRGVGGEEDAGFLPAPLLARIVREGVQNWQSGIGAVAFDPPTEFGTVLDEILRVVVVGPRRGVTLPQRDHQVRDEERVLAPLLILQDSQPAFEPTPSIVGSGSVRPFQQSAVVLLLVDTGRRTLFVGVVVDSLGRVVLQSREHKVDQGVAVIIVPQNRKEEQDGFEGTDPVKVQSQQLVVFYQREMVEVPSPIDRIHRRVREICNCVGQFVAAVLIVVAVGDCCCCCCWFCGSLRC